MPSLPKSAPISFIRERWARHVLRGGSIDRRYYELCVLSELRDRLRAGDVWVVGSRRYRAFEERLISRETLKELERGGTLPIAVDADFERFISARRALLERTAGGNRRQGKGRLAARCHARQGRAEDHADREIDAARGRGPRRAPLRDAAAHPDHRSPVGGGAMDAVHRLLHPSADRRNCRRFAGPYGEPPRRRAQSRPDADGRGVQHRQPRAAGLDIRLAHPR